MIKYLVTMGRRNLKETIAGLVIAVMMAGGGVSCLCLVPGCSFLAPGYDTRMAAAAKSQTTWDAEDNLSITEDTTHNREVLAIEGEAVTLERENGEVKSVGGATHVLYQKSEPKDVMEAYSKLAEANAALATEMLNLVRDVAPLLKSRSDSGSSGPSNADRMTDAVIGILTPPAAGHE